MKKIFLLIGTLVLSVALVFFALNVSKVSAGTYNGGAVSTPATGPGGGCPGGKPCAYHTSIKGDSAYATYIVRVIYSTGNALTDGSPEDNTNWKVIGNPVVIVGGNAKSGSFDHTGMTKSYADAKGASVLYDNWLAKDIFKMEMGDSSVSASTITDKMNADDNAKTKSLLNSMNANNSDLYTEENNRAPAYGKSGYRIIIEKLIPVTKDGSTIYLTTRKTLAREYGYYDTADGHGFWMDGTPAGSAYSDIHTIFNDINVEVGNTGYDNFKSYNKGAGLHIYDPNYLDELTSPNNFSIDAACEDCTGDNGGGSYYIQNTTNWKSILDSGKNKNANVQKHFAKDHLSDPKNADVFCREEYKIEFPNASTTTSGQIYTDKGDYFTVNLDADKLIDNHANFSPIKVTRVMQCRSKSKTKSNLRAFRNTYKSNVTAGGVELCYLEGSNGLNGITKSGGLYSFASGYCTGSGQLNSGVDYSTRLLHGYLNPDDNSLTKMREKKVSYTDNYSSINGSGTLTMTRVSTYILPKNIYRYISKANGRSQYSTPTNKKEYTDTGTANLPVSLTTEGKTIDGKKIHGAIKLKYVFPSSGSTNHTYMGEAFAANQKDYFGSKNVKKKRNIYNDDINIDGESKEDTACAKLFGGTSTDKYQACANERKNKRSKMGSCKSMNNNNYICPIMAKNDTPNTCKKIDGKCYKNGVKRAADEVNCESVNKGSCVPDCPPGGCKNKCIQITDDTCQLYQRKDNKGAWVPIDGTEKKCSDYETVDRYRDEGCEPLTNNCPNGGEDCTCEFIPASQNKCKLYEWKNGTRSSKTVYCSTYPQLCPCTTGKCSSAIAIYRTIDLDNPFPSIKGSGRKAGSNWCSYDASGDAKCKLNNSKIISSIITNNRGVKTENVYSKTPMYVFELDSSDLEELSKKGKDYGDFNLNCTNGKVCLSDVVKSYVTGGTCQSRTKDTFYSCKWKG